MAIQDDIKKFTLEINESRNNGETLASLTKLEKETAKLRTENEQLEKVMGHLVASGKKNSDEYKRMDAQLKANRKSIRSNNDAMKGLRKNLDLNYMSMNQLKKRSNELRGSLNGMSKAANPEEYNRLEKELKDVGQAMGKLKGNANQTQGMLGKLKGVASGALPALGWGAVAAGAVAAGKKVAEFIQQTHEARQQVQQLTKLSGKDLANLTADIQATSDTFKVGFDEMAVANNNFAKSMDISNEYAQSLINDGFLSGADASGEFLAMLTEYGPQLREAGYSAEEAIALMSQNVESGVFTDKGIDVIKEASLRLREMPNSTREALDAIGISSEEMMNKLASGEITVQDAIQQVSLKMGELPPQSSEVGTAIADIFGGPGEDAGLEFIKMLGTAETSLDTLKEKTGETAEAQELMLRANKELNKAWSDLIGTGTGGFTKLKANAKLFLAQGITAMIKGIQNLRNWFIDFYNKSAPVRAFIGGMGFVWKTQINLITANLKSLWIRLKTVANAIKAVFSEGSLKEKAKNVKEAFSQGWDESVEVINKAREKQAENWEAFKDQVKNGQLEMPPVKAEVEIDTTQEPLDVSSGSVPKSAKPIDPKEAEKVHQMYLKAQQALQEAITANLEDSLEKQLQLENDKWAKEKAGLEAQLIDKEDLTAEELAINELLKKTIEEKEKTHQQTLTDLRKTWEEKERLDKLQAVIDDGQVTFDTEMALLDEKYAQGLIKHREYEEQKKQLTDKYSKERFDTEQKWLENANTVANSLSNINLARKNIELAQAGDNAKEREEIEKRFAKRQQKIASSQALINGALAVTKILAEVPKGDFGIMTGILIAGALATTAAEVAEINSQQFADGRYPVRGASDGRLYSAGFVGKPGTGIYNQPSLGLFSERKPEGVIDGDTMQRLTWNYPHIWRGITTLASGGIPQFADGRYPASTSSASNAPVVERVETDPELRALMQANLVLMQKLDREGVRTELNTRTVKKMNDSYDKAIADSDF